MFKCGGHTRHVAGVESIGRGTVAPLRDSGSDFPDNLSGGRLLQPALARHAECHVKRGGIVGHVDREAQDARPHVYRRRVLS